MEKHIILEMKHIVKKYGDFTAVNDVNFSMKRGEIVAVIAFGIGKEHPSQMYKRSQQHNFGRDDFKRHYRNGISAFQSLPSHDMQR